MDIFYININDFKKNHDIEFLKPYADKKFINEKRFWEYTIGRYLIRDVAKKIYNIQDEITTLDNGKPIFKNSELFFSISHSVDFIIVCFDKYPCGIDIEYIKQRNLSKVAARYHKIFQNLIDFYKFWTYKEATYKLGTDAKYYEYKNFSENYYLTVVSSKPNNSISKIENYEHIQKQKG